MSPLVYRWDGEAMRPLSRFAREADRQFTLDETYFLGDVAERSEVSHRHEFAWLREAWLTLPDAIAADFPSPEHLRKRALISTGWCDVRDYPCASRAEALRLAATLRGELDEYTVIIARDAVVRVLRAKSQSRGKMKAADFTASKQAILDWVANLLGVEPGQISQGSNGGKGSGGANNVPAAAA